MISISKFDYYKMPISMALLLCYPVKFKGIFMLIMVTPLFWQILHQYTVFFEGPE